MNKLFQKVYDYYIKRTEFIEIVKWTQNNRPPEKPPLFEASQWDDEESGTEILSIDGAIDSHDPQATSIFHPDEQWDKIDLSLIIPDDRFVWKPGDVTVFDENGKIITDFRKDRLEHTTIFEIPSVGDIVKLKITGQIVVVIQVDYVNDEVLANYRGRLIHAENVYVFGQDSIEKKYSLTYSEYLSMK